MRSAFFFTLLLFSSLFAQSERTTDNSKVLLTVPMIGRGTWEDPKRPALVQEAGVPFRYEVPDDGTMAIVQASPRNLAESAKLSELAEAEPRAKLYRPDKDRKSDVVGEFKKLKMDFDPETFGLKGPPVKVAPGNQGDGK